MITNERLQSNAYSFQKSWNIIKKGWETLVEDYAIVMKRAQAAKNWLEVLFLYPGHQAIILYRIAH
mgnify:FL=1